MRSDVLRRLLLVVLVGVFVGCDPAVTATPSPRAVTATPSPRAVATVGPSEPTPDPTAIPPAVGTSLTWVPYGELSGSGRVLGWWFSAGYLVMSDYEGDDQTPDVWFSEDGVDWHPTELAVPIRPCPGWVSRPSAAVTHGWAAGGGAMLIGVEYVPDAVPCDSERIVAWRSGDGITWTKTTAFGPDGDLAGYPLGIWATPDGWEAAIRAEDESVWIWQSPGGDQWQRVAQIAEHAFVRIAVANDGTRLAVAPDSDDETTELLVSTDGKGWHQVDGPPRPAGSELEDWGVARVLPPDGSRAFWTVVTTLEDDALSTNVWISDDLRSWEGTEFPMPATEMIAHTPEGIVALGSDPCRDTGGPPCETQPSHYFVSVDGLAWEPMLAAEGPYSLVEGPAGVLGVGLQAPDADSSTIYRLERVQTP